jgi:hypothetical protein
MRVKSVLAGEGGECTPTPSHYIYPHHYSIVAVYAPAEWADTLTMFHLYTVKNAVELLGAPSRNSVLMLKKYNITDEIFWLFSHVFFFYPANKQESSTLAQYKNFVLVSD